MKNSVLKGSLILLIAGIIAKILGAVYRIPLSNILGADGIGIYQMIFPIFSLFLIISSGGVSTTVSYYVSKIRATNCGNEKKVFLFGFLFSLCTSVFFAVIFLLFSKNIAILQGNTMASSGYKVSAIALVFASLLASFRGLYQGQQNMLPTALSQIIEQAIKVCCGLGFAVWFSKFGLSFGVCGAFVGVAISEVVAFIFLVLKTKKHKFFVGLKKENFNLKKNFLKTNCSITLCSVILPLLTAFDSFVVVNILNNFYSNSYATSLYGLQSGIVTSLINFPIIISVAISLALLPNLSCYIAKNDVENASKNLSYVVEIMLIILIPFVLAFIFFAKEIMIILYPTLDENIIDIGTKLLQVSAVNVLGLSFLQIFVSVFQSFGKPQTVVWVLFFYGLLRIANLVLLTSKVQVNIVGVALSNVIFYCATAITLLLLIKKKIPLTLNKNILSTCIMCSFVVAVSFFAINVYFESMLAKIFVAGVCGLIFYVLPFVFLGNFNIKKYFAKNSNQLKENINE